MRFIKSSINKLKLIFKKTDFLIWRLRTKLRHILNNTQGDVNKILWVDPRQIKKVGIGWGDYNRLHEMGKVKSGNWDLNTMNFEDFDVYQSLKERFVNKVKWEDLAYYKTNKEKILNGEILWGIRSLEEFNKRLEKLDSLYANIKENGYSSQQKSKGFFQFKKEMDEITVRIARDGEVLFENGRHRLSISKILGLTKIPVIVTWRHKEWNDFLILLKRHSRNKNFDNFGFSIDNQGFDVKLQEDYRYQLIKDNLSIDSGSLLELGAKLSYFSHRFEEDGFKCFTIETDEEMFELSRKLKFVRKKNFTVIKADIFGFDEKSNFDVVLALNVLQLGLKTEKSYTKMKYYLNRLKARVIFFEINTPDRIEANTWYKNLNALEFVEFICHNTNLTQWKLIHESKSGSFFYKIY